MGTSATAGVLDTRPGASASTGQITILSLLNIVAGKVIAHIWPTHHENAHFYGTHSVDIDSELAQLDTDGYRAPAPHRRTRPSIELRARSVGGNPVRRLRFQWRIVSMIASMAWRASASRTVHGCSRPMATLDPSAPARPGYPAWLLLHRVGDHR